MNQDIPYNGSLTREKYLLNESRIVAKLKQNEGLTNEEIVEKVYEENLFQYPSKKAVKSIAKACCKRVDSLNDATLVGLLIDGTSDQKNQINLYAMMRTYRIMWEFMIMVVGEKYQTYDYSLTKADINNFLHHLQETSDRVASWSEATIVRIRGTISNSLAAAGLIDNLRVGTLNPIYLDWELEQGIRRNHDEIVLPSFNCFR